MVFGGADTVRVRAGRKDGPPPLALALPLPLTVVGVGVTLIGSAPGFPAGSELVRGAVAVVVAVVAAKDALRALLVGFAEREVVGLEAAFFVFFCALPAPVDSPRPRGVPLTGAESVTRVRKSFGSSTRSREDAVGAARLASRLLRCSRSVVAPEEGGTTVGFIAPADVTGGGIDPSDRRGGCCALLCVLPHPPALRVVDDADGAATRFFADPVATAEAVLERDVGVYIARLTASFDCGLTRRSAEGKTGCGSFASVAETPSPSRRRCFRGRTSDFPVM